RLIPPSHPRRRRRAGQLGLPQWSWNCLTFAVALTVPGHPYPGTLNIQRVCGYSKPPQQPVPK
ncbi:MAG: hypothetical protein J2P29_07585, partial [Actinobacteria bacterium]|nr:hypothetical protein [Actinomycetota bacterium]